MQLLNYNKYRFPQLKDETVKRKAIRKLYFAHDGRNAWWTTQVQRYLDGCMHSSLESAKNYAEGLRVQGSVFYINELPALLLESDSIVLAVTQINCSDVLAGYSSNAVANNAPSGRQKMANAQNNYLTRGSPLEGALLSFDHDGRFWNKTPPPRDSVIRVLCDGSIRDFEPLGEAALGAYKSVSWGSQYRLGWSLREHNVRSDALRKLVLERAQRPRTRRSSGRTANGALLALAR